MQQEQFLVDFFKPTDTVTVNASELQKVFQAKIAVVKANKALRLRIETLEGIVNDLRNEQPPFVDIRG